ncbi:MAG: mechanosensitive ion channel MscS, small conductance mechanosensitive channel, partial [Candidatus Saccharibacteria bacterium]|nr:mechanosensitive ion channel MscS, small conductance mechanosensitive channel [Candidatus Saccharibacteria bacterium]
QWRRVETSLMAILAIAKVVIFFGALYVAWRILNPSSTPVALVGASALFIVLASATVVPLLRDITYGTVMIAERWYNVGDHIVVEPFLGVSGIVEHVTLRSTKLRSLTGEIIWLHNQHVQGVRITPRGVKTLAIDVFVSDAEQGKKVMSKGLAAIPKEATMVARAFSRIETEKLTEDLWRLSAVGQTAPGREWLIEDFAIKAIKKYDESGEHDPVIIHGPIVRFADEAAMKRFKRTVRAKN